MATGVVLGIRMVLSLRRERGGVCGATVGTGPSPELRPRKDFA